jgi:tetratricopeptide (TPR) repeat protein
VKGDNGNAMKLFQQGENILKNIDINNPRLASTYINMGAIFQEKGELDKALEYLEKSREISIKNFGENHHELAKTYGNMGLFYQDKGELDKALEFQEKSREI